MATLMGGYSVPGSGALEQTTEYELFWGGDRGKGHVLEQSAKYASGMLDAGNTPTTVIRAGLLVGKETSSGELSEWDADATDGSEAFYGITPVEFRTIDFNAVAGDRVLNVIVRAPVKAAALLIEGVALVGHANEYIAREALHGAGFILDDDPQGYKAGAMWRRLQSNGDVTLTAAMTGTLFICHTADAAFTLPTAVDGLRYRMLMGADQELSIVGTGAMRIPGDPGGDSVTWTTAGEQQGLLVEVEAVDVAGTILWQTTVLKTPFSTDDYLAATLA